MKFINEVTEVLDGSHTTGRVFYDLSRAFGCVDHSTLLSKLVDNGISGSSISLIRSTTSQNFLQDARLSHFKALSHVVLG